MEVLRQTVKVKNHTINIVLPDDFNADFVDVIVLPLQNKKNSIPQLKIDQVSEPSIEYHKNPNIELDSDKLKNEFISDYVLTEEQMKILDERSKEDKSTFITAKESLLQLKKRYDL